MRHIRIFSSLLLLCLVVILSGCDPLGPTSQKGLDSELPAPVITLQGVSAAMVQLEWQPVFGATSYQITVKKLVDGAEPVVVSSINRSVDWLVANNSYIDGHFSYNIKSLDGKTKYEANVVAKRDATVSVASNVVSFETKDPYESAPDIKPDAYVQEVTANTITVAWRTIPGITKYVLTLSVKNSSTTVPIKDTVTTTGDSDTYEFTGLNENLDYTVWIQAAVEVPSTGELDVSIVYTELDITRDTGGTKVDATMPVPVFTQDKPEVTPQSIILTVQPNPNATSSDANYVMLLRKDTLNGEFSPVAWEPMPAGTGTVKLEDRHDVKPGSVYYYTVCNVKANGTGTSATVEARSKLSETIQVASALKLTATSTPNSITLSWSDMGDDIKYTIAVTDSEGVIQQLSQDDITTENGTCTLVYGSNSSPLLSKSEYTFSVLAATPANVQFSGTVSATTGSWAGAYRWVNPKLTTGKRANFYVTVEEVPAPEGSSYPYYVRVNAKDAAYVTGGDYRIMPLIDPAVDTDVPDDFILYTSDTTSYEKAYIWNEQKWNTLGMHPTSWKIKTAPTVEDMKKNIYTTLVNTKAFGQTLETTTTFQFRMYEGKPQILFTNKGTGSGANLVNLGLYKNPQPNTSMDEDDYTFALKLVEEVR